MASDLKVGGSAPSSLDHAGSDVGVLFVVVSNHADEPCRLLVDIVRMSRSKAATQVYGSRLLAPVTNTVYKDFARDLSSPLGDAAGLDLYSPTAGIFRRAWPLAITYLHCRRRGRSDGPSRGRRPSFKACATDCSPSSRRASDTISQPMNTELGSATSTRTAHGEPGLRITRTGIYRKPLRSRGT